VLKNRETESLTNTKQKIKDNNIDNENNINNTICN